MLTNPRTSSTRYPSTLDVVGTLHLLSEQPFEWAALAKWLLLAPPPVPIRGEARGEHPPVTPVGQSSQAEVEAQFGRTGWRLYEAVCVHFLATLLPDAIYQEGACESLSPRPFAAGIPLPAPSPHPSQPKFVSPPHLRG